MYDKKYKRAMYMIPLHVFCSNHSVNLDMIKQLVSKFNDNLDQVLNILGLTPLRMYLTKKCPALAVKLDDFISKFFISGFCPI